MDTGRVTVLIRDYLSRNRRLLATVVTFYGDARSYKNYKNIARALSKNAYNRSISVVCLVHSMRNYDQFLITDHGYAAVASRRLRFLTVSCGRLREKLNMLKIAPRKNQDGGSVTVDPGTSPSCLRTQDGYPTDNPELIVCYCLCTCGTIYIMNK